MKKAKKVVALALCAVMLVVGSVAGTMAYLTSTTNVVENTFTVGNVAIKLNEVKVGEDGKALASGERTESNSYHLLPGQTYDKDPMVTVAAGSEDSYVRAFVTVEYNAAADAVLAKHNYMTWFDLRTDKWAVQPNVETEKAGDKITRTYELRYKDKVEKPASDTELEALFTKITVPGGLTNEEIQALDGFKINVVAHAIHATGFENADAAWSEWK